MNIIMKQEIESRNMNIIKNQKESSEYEGGCLCGETTFTAKGKPNNPHLCSCTMCVRNHQEL
jgi:hypothetical protein